MGRDFKFSVREEWEWVYDGLKDGERPTDKRFTGKWTVCLPHQCDEWEITDYDNEGETHPMAVKS